MIDAARQKLDDEFDMEKMAHLLRVSRLVSFMKLSRRQRMAVEYFSRYTVQQKDIGEEDGRSKRGMSVEQIVNGLYPEENKIDRRILYELTG